MSMQITVISLLNVTNWGEYPNTVVGLTKKMEIPKVGSVIRKIKVGRWSTKKPANGVWKVLSTKTKTFYKKQLTGSLKFESSSSAGGAFGEGVNFTRVREVTDFNIVSIFNSHTNDHCHIHVGSDYIGNVSLIKKWIEKNSDGFSTYVSSGLTSGLETLVDGEIPTGSTKENWYIPYN